LAIAPGDAGDRSLVTPDKGFVSPSHRQSVFLTNEAHAELLLGHDERATELTKLAGTLAQSMGDSGRYGTNPFSEKEHADLHRQFTLANSLRMQGELDIVGKESDIGHGL
jgi:hypothetical protein